LRSSLVQDQQGQACRLVLRVQLDYRAEAAALLLKLICLGCQPEPGVDYEKMGAAKLAHDEPGKVSTNYINRHSAIRGIQTQSPKSYGPACNLTHPRRVRLIEATKIGTRTSSGSTA
jgi:hypothetical protein